MNSGLTLHTQAPRALDLKHLSAYAEYLLNNRLRAFVEYITGLTIDLDLPVLQFYDLESLSREDVIKLSIPSNEEFLKFAAQNNLRDHIEFSVNEWVSNRIPNLKREQIALDDILLAMHSRKKALLHFIRDYTTDAELILRIAGETEEYALAVHKTSVAVYVAIQEEALHAANKELEKNREKLLQAQEVAQVGSFEWDLTGSGRSEYTPQVYRIFEMENLGNIKEFFDNVHPGDREKVSEALQKAIRGDGNFECEYRYISRSGEKILWSKGIVVVVNNQPSHMKGLVMDVTHRHYTLYRLERNERLYKQAQALAHIGNWTYEVISEKFTCSDELYRILGLTPDSAQDELSIEKFFNLLHDDDKESIMEKFFELAKGNSVEDSVARIKTESGELKYIKGNGQVLKDNSGKPYKVIGTCQDITKEMKLTEALKQREELLEKLNLTLNEKNLHLEDSNKELSAFGYVVSHDLQEPLRKIKLFGDLLLEKENVNLTEEGKMLLGRIINSSGRMQKLINDLLSFSRTQTGDKSFENVDLNSVIDNIITFYEESVNRKKPIINRTQLPLISGIAFQVAQLFENIISNSVKYSKDGAVVIIDIFSEEVTEETIHGAVRYYKISVKDNGIGFDQQYATKIFEIFQRLHGKAEYSGTGIGLSICKKIIENHSGKIVATGVPNQGARFDIFFPVVQPSSIK